MKRATPPSAGWPVGPSRTMSTLRQRVRSFLDGPATCVALVGPCGTGKLYATQQAARDKGLVCVAHDRAQGFIAYKLWGAATLANDGLARTLNILCNADSETDFSFIGHMPQGCKVVCIANDGQALKAARILCEHVKPLTAEEMAKLLFLEKGWEAAAAQRLARLAQGDWRQLKTLARLFNDAGINVSTQDEEEFAEACERMARDRKHDCHPSLRAHSVFSGNAPPEDYEDPEILARGERNLGVTCDTLESMALMQEAASTTDVLCTSGAWSLGLDHFARSATCLGQKGRRCEYAAFVNPWSTPAEAKTKSVRESFTKLVPWSRSLKRKLAEEQYPTDATPKPKAKGKARKVKARSTVQ